MDVQIVGGHGNVVKDTDLREYDTVSLDDWFLLFWTKRSTVIFMDLDVKE